MIPRIGTIITEEDELRWLPPRSAIGDLVISIWQKGDNGFWYLLNQEGRWTSSDLLDLSREYAVLFVPRYSSFLSAQDVRPEVLMSIMKKIIKNREGAS